MTDLSVYRKHKLANLSTDILKQEFAKSLKITADRLAYMANIYLELSKRGVDLSGLKGGLIEYMPLIASNQIDARLVVEYAGNKTLLASLSKLTMDEQQKLIDNPSLSIVSMGDDKSQVVTKVNLHEIKASDIFLAIDPAKGQVRNSEEQYQILLIKNKTSKKKSKNRKVNKVKIDGEYIVVANYDINIKSVLQALSDATGKDYFSI